MDKSRYRPRLVDKRLDFYLSTFPAVAVEGPKWCGKTWTSTMHAQSVFMLADPLNNFSNREIARLDVDEAAARLCSIASRFVHNPPRSLAVVVGVHGIAHRRPDGVYVLPLTSLKD